MDKYMCCGYGGDKQQCQTCGNFEHIFEARVVDPNKSNHRRESKDEVGPYYKCNICNEREGHLREIAPLPHDYVAEVPNEEVAEELNEDNNYEWEVDDDEESGKQIMKYQHREDDEDGSSGKKAIGKASSSKSEFWKDAFTKKKKSNR